MYFSPTAIGAVMGKNGRRAVFRRGERAGVPRAHSIPSELELRSNFLFGRIFCGEPVSTSPENALEL